MTHVEHVLLTQRTQIWLPASILGDPQPPVTAASVGTGIHVLISIRRHINEK